MPQISCPSGCRLMVQSIRRRMRSTILSGRSDKSAVSWCSVTRFPSKVYQPRADGVRAERCNEDQRSVSTELNQSRRTSACGFPCIVFVNKAQFGQGCQPVGNDSSAVFAGPFNGEARVRATEPNQRQDFGQTGYDRLLGSYSLTFVFLHRLSRVIRRIPPGRLQLG